MKGSSAVWTDSGLATLELKRIKGRCESEVNKQAKTYY